MNAPDIDNEPSIYRDNRSTFKVVSEDTEHHVSMIGDMTIPVYNFDDIKNKYIVKCSIPSNPHSCDALYVDDNQIVLIEFKNGNIKLKDIILKLYDSLMILFDEGMGLQWRRKDYEANISYSRMNISFILVCRKEKIPIRNIHGHVARRADLGLGTWKGYLYRDVEVYTPEEFESYFIKQWHANQ